MLKKGTKLYAIIFGVCPRCHRESMYTNANSYVLSDTLKMHERCSHCNTKYKIEPSFFYGAMYISYAVGIAFATASFVITYGFIGTSLKTSFIGIVLTLIFCLPVILRLSRNIWINFFIHFDPDR